MPQEHGSAIQLRHPRYFIALAEMGSLTEARSGGLWLPGTTEECERARLPVGASPAGS